MRKSIVLPYIPGDAQWGKLLFDKETIPAGYALVESKTSPSGVIIATFKRAGDAKVGSFQRSFYAPLPTDRSRENPTHAPLKREKKVAVACS